MEKICILGGGPSGMAAAITVARNYPDIPITILEKNPQLGKKLLATGNGRCNITNSSILGGEAIIDFLNTVGIYTREEDAGRIYPFSGRAEDVVGLLRDSLLNLGVTAVTDFCVKEVEIKDSGFVVHGHNGKAKEEVNCSKVVLALGGKAAPQFGTIGEGYYIAKALGLSLTKTFPGLTWVEVLKGGVDLQGLRVKGSARLFRKGQLISLEEGEIQFTRKGLSGICIFNLSSQVVLDNNYSFEDYEICIDLMEEHSIKQARDLLKQRSELRGMTLGNILCSIVPRPMEKEILSRAGVSLGDLNKPAHALKDSTLSLISDILKRLEYQVKGIGGWKDAQITIGGVSLNEINQQTWEANGIPGLYVIGELLDKQGPSGGYNLHNAWKTGIEAGIALGK